MPILKGKQQNINVLITEGFGELLVDSWKMANFAVALWLAVDAHQLSLRDRAALERGHVHKEWGA